MDIWIFNHYAQGANLPGGTRHYDLAKQLVSFGHKVTIFAAGFHYTLLEEKIKYKNNYKIENIDGITFVWIKTFPYKINNIRRMLNIFSYAWNINKSIKNMKLSKPDFIIGSTVHPFAAFIASKLAKEYNIPFIFEIRDLWPQTFIDMNLWKKNSLKSLLFKYIEKITVNRSSRIIVLSPLTINYLVKEYNYLKENILLLPNGINDNFIIPIKQFIKDKVNITYLGGIDKVHGLEFLIDLAFHLKGENIEFIIYGDGKERKELENMKSTKNLDNVQFRGSVPKSKVSETLADANLLFVSTSNVLYGSENKLYEYMATGKPIIVATTGQHNNPIKNIKCGISLDRSDVISASDSLKGFISNNDKYKFELLGKNGQDYVISHRRIKILAKKLEKFCKELI